MDIRKLLALSLAAVILVFAGTTAAFANHRDGHDETPSCDDHPNNGGPQNKHCEATAPAPAQTTPPTTPPPTTPPPAPVTPTQVTPPSGGGGGGGGGNGGGGGGGGAVAEPAAAVPADTLPFTGFELPDALLAAGVLLLLGGTSLALGRRRAQRIH